MQSTTHDASKTLFCIKIDQQMAEISLKWFAKMGDFFLTNSPKCMLAKSTILKTNFGTYVFHIFSLSGCQEIPWLSGPVWHFLASSVIDGLIKLFITFDRLNRFYRMIACFKGPVMSVYPVSFDHLKTYTAVHC
jgi:hypothetical protein